MSVAISILASGRGSNFEAIAKAVAQKQLNAKILSVISDRADAVVLEKARALGIPSRVVLPDSEGSPEQRRQRHDQAVVDALQADRPDFLVMAGYMRIVTPILLEPFRDRKGYTRVTNIHPSLLPSFPGVRSYGQAFRYGCKVAGVTVHLVEPEIDAGPICAQEAFEIGDCRTEEEVEKRGLAVEHRLYPQVLGWLLSGKFEIVKREGRWSVSPN